MSTGSMQRQAARSTQLRRAIVQRDTPFVRDADRRRGALALSLTLRLAGKSGKQAARILDKDTSTVSRYIDGEHDTPFSRLRADVRKMCEAGVYPVPVLVDLLAEMWGCAMKDWTLGELIRRKRDLHRHEQRSAARVDLWQLDDLEGMSAEDENAVDEALLEQATRTIELYLVRQEIRLRNHR